MFGSTAVGYIHVKCNTVSLGVGVYSLQRYRSEWVVELKLLANAL